MACEDLIQFDIEAVTSNIVNKYSMLQFINQQNYDEMKKNYSGNFPGYFSGSYDDFRQQRNEFTKLFVAAGFSSQQGSAYRRTLSAASADAYGRCLAEHSRKPVSAWIGECTDSKIAINIRNGLNEDVDYEVVGEKPLNGDGVLPDGGTEIIIFDYDPSRSFMVAFNGVGRVTRTTDTALVQLEKVKHYEIRKTQKELTATFTCGAGCQGDQRGCPISTDAVFVADLDYYLLYESRKTVRTDVLGGPGLMNYDLVWTADPGDRPRRIVAHPTGMRGNSEDTQGIIQVTCSIIAEREYIVEVINTGAAAAAA